MAKKKKDQLDEMLDSANESSTPQAHSAKETHAEPVQERKPHVEEHKSSAKMSKKEFESKLTELFTKHKVSKLWMVEKIANNFAGNEEEVLDLLHKKYVDKNHKMASYAGKPAASSHSHSHDDSHAHHDHSAHTEAPKKSKKGLIIAILLIVVIGGAAGAYFMMGGKKAEVAAPADAVADSTATTENQAKEAEAALEAGEAKPAEATAPAEEPKAEEKAAEPAAH